MGQFCATESERCGRCVVVECDSACAARPSTDVLLASLRAAVERLGGSAEERRLALLVLEKLDAEQLRAAYAVIIEKKPLVVISGPAGSGKSELLKLFMAVVGKEKTRVVANGL